MKIEKLKTSTVIEIVKNLEQNVYRGLIMTGWLVAALYMVPKTSIFHMILICLIFMNIVLIAYVIAAFKSDMVFKEVWDLIEAEKAKSNSTVTPVDPASTKENSLHLNQLYHLNDSLTTITPIIPVTPTESTEDNTNV